MTYPSLLFKTIRIAAIISVFIIGLVSIVATGSSDSKKGGESGKGAIQPGETRTGSIRDDQWAYYEMNVPRGTSQLKVEVSASGGDIDLLIAHERKPDENMYDAETEDCYRAVDDGQSVECTIPSPATGTWHIGLWADGNTEYTLRATLPSNGDGGAQPPVGDPISPPGGDPQPPSGGDPIPPPGGDPQPPPGGSQSESGSLVDDQWLHRQVQVPQGTSQLKVEVSVATGEIDLLIAYGVRADEDVFFEGTEDCWDIATPGQNALCQIPSPTAGTWHIGLWSLGDAEYTLTITLDHEGTGADPVDSGYSEYSEVLVNSRFSEYILTYRISGSTNIRKENVVLAADARDDLGKMMGDIVDLSGTVREGDTISLKVYVTIPESIPTGSEFIPTRAVTGGRLFASISQYLGYDPEARVEEFARDEALDPDIPPGGERQFTVLLKVAEPIRPTIDVRASSEMNIMDSRVGGAFTINARFDVIPAK